MAARDKGYQGLSPAEQRAARDQRLAEQVSAVELAKAREMKMVASLGRFTDECRWFIGNKVWLTLGYETLVAWWADRISPLVDGLGLRPGPELAQMAIEAIQEEESTLPPAQRHSKTAISRIVGVGEWKARGRQDQRSRRSTANVDLANPAVIDVEPSNVTDEPTTQTAAGAPTTPADGADTPEASVSDTAPAGSVDASPLDGPGNPPDSPAADSLPPQAHAGVPAVGGQEQERIDEELMRCPLCAYAVAVSDVDPDASVSEMNSHLGRTHNLTGEAAGEAWKCVRLISPAADPMPHIPTERAYPIATPQQPGQDSPPVSGSEGFPSRAETDHHRVEGGEAPEVPRPSVELEGELEGGVRASLSTPSSSDYLMHLFASLVHGLTGLDAEALGPQLLGEEIELLHQHIDDITDFVARAGRARFAEMTRTP